MLQAQHGLQRRSHVLHHPHQLLSPSSIKRQLQQTRSMVCHTPREVLDARVLQRFRYHMRRQLPLLLLLLLLLCAKAISRCLLLLLLIPPAAPQVIPVLLAARSTTKVSQVCFPKCPIAAASSM
jgi:hypothetical protein